MVGTLIQQEKDRASPKRQRSDTIESLDARMRQITTNSFSPTAQSSHGRLLQSEREQNESMMQILLEWVTSGDNYARWSNCESKLAILNEIISLLSIQDIHHHTHKSIRAKINALEVSLLQAMELVDSGVQRLQTFDSFEPSLKFRILVRCPYFEILVPVMLPHMDKLESAGEIAMDPMGKGQAQASVELVDLTVDDEDSPCDGNLNVYELLGINAKAVDVVCDGMHSEAVSGHRHEQGAQSSTAFNIEARLAHDTTITDEISVPNSSAEAKVIHQQTRDGKARSSDALECEFGDNVTEHSVEVVESKDDEKDKTLKDAEVVLQDEMRQALRCSREEIKQSLPTSPKKQHQTEQDRHASIVELVRKRYSIELDAEREKSEIAIAVERALATRRGSHFPIQKLIFCTF